MEKSKKTVVYEIMEDKQRKRIQKVLLLSVKIAFGSSIAIYIAEMLNLEFANSAGTIALLTLMTTKWETVKLSLWRLVTFVLSTLLAGFLILHFKSEWIAFGIFILIVTAVSDYLGWRATISVNAVIGSHFLVLRDFSFAMIWNEFQIVLIGIIMAILLNLFHGNQGRLREIAKGMRYAEVRLQRMLKELSGYLKNEPDIHVWGNILKLKQEIQEFIQEAYEYQDNTFQDMGYYYDYLEMRLEQCNVLHNLHHEMQKIRTLPVQAAVVAEYIDYMAEYVVEINHPRRQLERLDELFELMKLEPLPASREEFENRAILYHVLMDLEEFLWCKERFVKKLTPEKLEKYWKDASGFKC